MGTATGETASWIAVGLPELGLDGGALRNMTCSAAIRRTSPPEIRTASMEMRYLPRIVAPASATNAQSPEAINSTADRHGPLELGIRAPRQPGEGRDDA